MFKFLVKGIFRDRHRYLFPLVIVSSGIMILVFALSYMRGYEESFVGHNARFETGHLKVVTRAYSQMLSQKPVDLAMLNIADQLAEWKKAYPQLDWAERIYFAALLDVPDSLRETREQGEVVGYGIDLLSSDKEIKFLGLDKALVQGRLPDKPGEVLVSRSAIDKLGIRLGEEITLISSTVDGAMEQQNFIPVGAVNFGVLALDKGAVIADISDVRTMLALEGGAGEILAFLKSGKYDPKALRQIKKDFNSRFSGKGEYDPVMLELAEQNDLGFLMRVMDQAFGIMGFVFILILGIVLWNSGLMSGIRRWGEFGVRLAIGESKRHVYRSLLVESLILGVVGSLLGTLFGLAVCFYFHKHGVDLTAYSKASTIVANNIIYPAINMQIILTGLIPGVLATVLGAALAGVAIFKRQTSQLFKELES